MRALLAAAAVAVILTAGAGAAPPPTTKTPGVLTVGLAMPAAGFQVGAVRGRKVVLAKGFEIELARILARRLGIPRVVFLNERYFSTLLNAGPKDWDVALAEITVTPARATRVDFSRPYLAADQGVLARRGLTPTPTSIAALRRLKLCAERATTGAQLVMRRIKPRRKPLLLGDQSDLSYALFTKRCDAIVADAPTLAVQQRQATDRYGPLVGRIATREKYAIAFEKGSALRSQVDAVLRAAIRDRTVEQLRRRWLGVDTAKLPALR
jgi:polar amino acid transport system substrate-binding protein